MSHARSVAVILGADLRAARVIGADEEKAPLAQLPTAYVVALSVVLLFGIAGAAWWAWCVSRELTAMYAEGFRKAGMPEE